MIYFYNYSYAAGSYKGLISADKYVIIIKIMEKGIFDVL